MRTKILMTLFGTLALSTSAFAGPAPDANVGASMEVQIVQGASYKLRPAEFDGVQGSYSLSNGTTMRVSASQRRLFAEIDGHAKAELVAVAQNTFVSRDEDMKLVFDQLPFATEVTLTSKK